MTSADLKYLRRFHVDYKLHYPQWIVELIISIIDESGFFQLLN